MTMKIFNTSQIRAADAFTIKNEPVASIDLMERASNAFIERFLQIIENQLPLKGKIHIFCGQGNNGGDGLAIGRLLLKDVLAKNIQCYEVETGGKSADDFITNKARYANHSLSNVLVINNLQDMPTIHQEDIVIDALLGSGLNRKVEGLKVDVIQSINESGANVFAVDMPSGLFADSTQNEDESIIKANYTLSFQFPKLSFFMPSNAIYTGNWQILDIGLSAKFIEETDTPYYYIYSKFVATLLTPRAFNSHKGLYGHALIMAGSMGKMGAALLASKACLRSGAGLTSAYIPYCGLEAFQQALPEAMLELDSHKKIITTCPETFQYAAIGVGPGLGTDKITLEVLRKLMRTFKKPMVIDADALNLLSTTPELKDFLRPNIILTPHPKEFERLAGQSVNEWERLQKATEFAEDNQCIVVLKSAYTSIHLPDGRVFFNANGSPGMAKGGSGDVLTGIITALLAQGYTPENASILGVYLHGAAGSIAAEKYSVWSMLPSDLIECLPNAFKVIEKEKTML